jgi:DNA polymerase-3 subunit delta'
MKSDLLLSEQTEQAIHAFLNRPSHALVLLGAEGTGKLALAVQIATHLLQVDAQHLRDYPYFTSIDYADKAIPIEAIRELRSVTSLKTLGMGAVRRVIVIANAHKMTIEAQNALLKTLEEPPEDTVLILTAIPDEGLLPTILSRLTHVRVVLPTIDASRKYFAEKFPLADIDKSYLMSGGRPGVMVSLLNGDQNHPMVAAITTAKQLVSSEPFERMARVSDLAKDRQSAELLLDALGLVYRSLLQASAAKGNHDRLKYFHHVLEEISGLQELKRHNPNTKLVLTDLMWQL